MKRVAQQRHPEAIPRHPVRTFETPGSDWITRIADRQTIAYSVSADELSMPHVSRDPKPGLFNW